MTNTIAPAPRVALPRSQNRRLRSAVVATILVATAGLAASLGLPMIVGSPAAAQWQYPTTVEGLVEKGLIPKETLGSTPLDTVRWPYPTSHDALVEKGYIPTGS